MSAAQELAERGFEVEVFERNQRYVGGKARSVDVPGTNASGGHDFLPGEHGFRFFPGFYKHVTDTMKRIPYRQADGSHNPEGCFDNLTSTERIMIARYGKPAILAIASFPRSLGDLELIIKDMHGRLDVGLSNDEEEFFAARMWQLMTSCLDRRSSDYERLSWWDYLDADRFSDAYRSLLVAGLTRTLVAAQARSASTKTGGNILLQLIYTMMTPGKDTDQVLTGPTNDVWLDPWAAHLKDLGVVYHHGARVTHIEMKEGRVTHVSVTGKGGVGREVTADYFILAAPVERAAELVTPEMVKADATLGDIERLAQSVSWMNGIQFYLNEDPPITKGHIVFSDSEWALTGISQLQFWKGYDLATRFNGKVKGIISVDISDWLHTEYEGKLADDCDAVEVKEKVWAQLEKSLNVDGEILLEERMIEHWYLDRDIQWNPREKHDQDYEPLLVNTVNSWALRPEAVTRIPNLFLASDYVRTYTDLATMEGANEAARRAVNGIIVASGSKARLCEVWPFDEPRFFAPLKWIDQRRFDSGLPWSQELPLWMRILMVPWSLAFAAVFAVRGFIDSKRIKR